MRIGELSAASGVSARALRYYEEQGLLGAARSASGQRHYANSAVDRVNLIQQLFGAGLNSSTMVELLPCITDSSVRTHGLAVRLTGERDRITRNIASLIDTRDALDRVIGEADYVPSPTR